MEIDIETGDVTLRGTETGEGAPIVLLHAGGERRSVWEPVSLALAAHGYRAVAIDQRGHGDSGGSPADGLAAYADDVLAIVRWVGSPVVLVGASLGGLAILRALATPDAQRQVAGIVLVDVVPDPDPRRVREHLASNPATRDRLAHSPLVDDVLSQAAQLRAAAAELTVPTMLIRGENSPMSDPDIERFTMLVPHATIRTALGAGHLVARDAPAALTAAVLDHLAAITPKPPHEKPPSPTHPGLHLLQERGVDNLAHPGGNLGAHLRRVAARLHTYGVDRPILDAGMCHAAYGTDGFPQALLGLTERSQLRLAIGDTAERHVYCYASCDRAFTYPRLDADADADAVEFRDRFTTTTTLLQRNDLRAFAAITTANELDIAEHAHLPPDVRLDLRRALEPLNDLLTQPAIADIKKTLS